MIWQSLKNICGHPISTSICCVLNFMLQISLKLIRQISVCCAKLWGVSLSVQKIGTIHHQRVAQQTTVARGTIIFLICPPICSSSKYKECKCRCKYTKTNTNTNTSSTCCANDRCPWHYNSPHLPPNLLILINTKNANTDANADVNTQTQIQKKNASSMYYANHCYRCQFFLFFLAPNLLILILNL